MSYQYITKYTSPNSGYNNFVKHHNDPKYIVVHHWGVEGQSFSGVLNWLCNPKSYVSAHYVLKDNTVACILNQGDCGWHSGNKWYNMHSIGIECRPEMTDGDFETLVELVAQIWKDVGKELPIIGHKDIIPTACPGKYYTRLHELERRARAVNHPTQIPLVPEHAKPTPRGKMYRVRKTWQNVKSQLGAFRNLDNAIELASKHKGYSVYDEKGRCVWSGKKPPKTPIKTSSLVKTGQSWMNKILSYSTPVDGIVGATTKKNKIRLLQWALNKDYDAGLVLDGIWGPKTESALGIHYVKRGETQYLATAVEILLLLNKYNPNGVEIPGTVGNGCEKAVKAFQKKNHLVVDGIAGNKTIVKLVK